MRDSNYKKDSDFYRELPIFKKALTILQLVEHLIDGITIEECNVETAYQLGMIEHHRKSIMENALLIPVKIAGAEGDSSYDHKMENATVIRKAAREIITDTKGLEIAGFKEVEYLHLLQNEVEVFRPIFADWIKTFKSSNYNIDRWGLFNPPWLDYNDSAEFSDDLS